MATITPPSTDESINALATLLSEISIAAKALSDNIPDGLKAVKLKLSNDNINLSDIKNTAIDIKTRAGVLHKDIKNLIRDNVHLVLTDLTLMKSYANSNVKPPETIDAPKPGVLSFFRKRPSTSATSASSPSKPDNVTLEVWNSIQSSLSSLNSKLNELNTKYDDEVILNFLTQIDDAFKMVRYAIQLWLYNGSGKSDIDAKVKLLTDTIGEDVDSIIKPQLLEGGKSIRKLVKRVKPKKQ